jgi:hypothetical protein
MRCENHKDGRLTSYHTPCGNSHLASLVSNRLDTLHFKVSYGCSSANSEGVFFRIQFGGGVDPSLSSSPHPGDMWHRGLLDDIISITIIITIIIIILIIMATSVIIMLLSLVPALLLPCMVLLIISIIVSSLLTSLLIITSIIIDIIIIIMDAIRRHLGVFFRTQLGRGVLPNSTRRGCLSEPAIGPPIQGTCGKGDSWLTS